MSADAMTAAPAPGPLPRRRGVRADWRDVVRGTLPVAALAVMVVWIAALEPNALSYGGLTLLVSTAVPLVFATVAQMTVVTIGDIDLGIGAFVGLTNVVVARYLADDPAVGLLLLAAGVAAYALLGLLVHVRRIPSIVATLGASFVWFGLALLILPSPGGAVPGWLTSLWSWNPPLVPLPVLVAVVVAGAGHLLTQRVSYGVVLRGTGDDPVAVDRSGWSTLRVRVTAYAVAGALGTLAGLATTAVTASGDANASSGLTLLSVAAVVLGGGEFSGGIANAVGAVVGAVAISLVAPLLALLDVSSDYQTGIQGGILLAVLAGRAFARRDV